MPSASEQQPEFFQVRLKKAPKPRDYDCPHHSGEGETLLKVLQGDETERAAEPVRVVERIERAEESFEQQEEEAVATEHEEAQDQEEAQQHEREQQYEPEELQKYEEEQ